MTTTSKLATITNQDQQILDEALPPISKHGFYMTKEMAEYALVNPEAFKAAVLEIAEETIDSQKADTTRMDDTIFEAVEAIDFSGSILDATLQMIYILQELHLYNPKRTANPPQEDAPDLYRAYKMSQVLVQNIMNDVEQVIITLGFVSERLKKTKTQSDMEH